MRVPFFVNRKTLVKSIIVVQNRVTPPTSDFTCNTFLNPVYRLQTF